MNRINWVLAIIIVISVMFGGCAFNGSVSNGLSLHEIGDEGVLSDDINAYNIADNSFLGMHSVAVNSKLLIAKIGGAETFLINTYAEKIPFKVNPFDENILEVSLSDSYSLDDIREFIVTPWNKAIQDKDDVLADGIFIEFVTIMKDTAENGSNLYRIPINTFISMRNANVFVFDSTDEFIAPEYITNNEGNTYSLNTFTSARNASDNPSVGGAFEFLKSLPDHSDYLEQINPNIVDVSGGEIIVIPPETVNLEVFSVPEIGGQIQIDEGPWQTHQTITKNLGDSAVLGVQVNTDYTFEGWYESETLLSTDASHTLTINNDRTIEARFLEIVNNQPTIQKVSGVSGTISQTSATFKWSGSDSDGSVDHYEYKKDDLSWQSTSLTQYSWGGYAVGVHTFYVRAVDNKGAYSNVISWTFTYEEPIVNYTVNANSQPVEGGDVKINSGAWGDNVSQTLEEGSQVQLEYRLSTDYTFDGWYEDSILLSTQNPLSFSLNSNRTIEARFSQIQNEPPIVEKVSGVSGTISQTSATFKWSGSDSDGSVDHYKYRKDSGSWQTTSSTQYTWSGYTEGSHTFSVKALDNDGAESETVSWTFTYSQPTGDIVYRALLIGIEDYEGGNDLTWTYDDVLDIETVMNNQNYNYQIEKMGGVQRVTKAQLLSKLDEYVQNTSIDSNDVFFFGYSGHGGYGSGTSYMVSSDLLAVTVGELRSKLDNIPGTKIVSIDACQSGDFINISGLRADESMDAQALGAAFIENVIEAFKTQEGMRGAFVTPYEYYAMAAAAIDEYSWESSSIENGFYSFFLADGVGHVGLSNPTGAFDFTYNADANSNNSITLAELYSYISTNVYNQTHSFDVQTVQVYPTNSDYVLFEYAARTNSPPSITKISGEEGLYADNSNDFQWSSIDSDGTIDHYKYRKDSGSWETTSSTQYTWSGYTEGSHTFSVKALDNDGAESETVSWTFTYSPSFTQGLFKVANSWGVGGSWENVPDGFYYMTYETFLANVKYVYVAEKSYTPTKAIAVFKMSHDARSDCNISIGVGNPASPEKILHFSGHTESFNYLSGALPYPNNVMVMDITPLLPVSNKTIFIEVFDKAETANTGTLESFKIEVYAPYSSNKTAEYTALDVPLNTVDGAAVYSQINNLSISSSRERALSSPLEKSSRRINDVEYSDLKQTMGVAHELTDYNEIINGYGTGYRPPTESEWAMMQSNGMLREITSFESASRPSEVDNSATKYFPPIGSQGSKGSCSSWSTVYYTGTYYNAMRYNTDISGAQWVGGYYGSPTAAYDQYIMSPDFAYLQLNQGGNNGTSIFDNIHLMHLVGNASWESCPYDLNNFTQWPNETAWREAPKFRLNWKSDWVFTHQQWYPWFYLQMSSYEDIETLKALLASGYLVSISVDAGQYGNFTAEDVWNINNYDSSGGTNHANTLVGYSQ